MATRSYIGNAANIKQTATVTIANTWAQNDTATLTIDNVDFVVTIGTLVTTAQVATTLSQAFNGETLTDTSASCSIPVADGGAQLIPQFAELVSTVSGSVVTFTARTAGKPFTMTAGESTAGTGTATLSAGTANAGDGEADNADNYSGNTVIVDNDTLVLDQGSKSITRDLNTAIQLAQIDKYMSYTGNVGIAEVNADNSSKPYREYRTPTYFTTDNNSVTSTLNLELGTGPGSGRLKFDTGAGQAVVNVYGKGTRAETGVPCVLWKGTHASNVVNNLAGDLGIAFFSGETATVATLRSGDGPTSVAQTVCKSGVTLTTVVMNGGTLSTDSAMTTGTQNGGVWSHGSGTITTLNVNGGTFQPLAGATITTLNLTGTLDATKGTASFTITNTIQMYKGARFLDPQGRAGNIVFRLNGCSPADVTIVLPQGKTYTLS